eukprot:CAMPEP_0206602828 /NCGR_PEP_ID=MMETSP0325_2-20121206/47749_1 /ASSEMBLY_ACC=CAM_ASM_000347 /TAXON_ID=2866 /ORGANISM="Crypthecodinium cohnii, Strain Seligo" /LENGTH=43 /DNA_ID= /DNA_START= /DNA_END= /DNA_ORIENTATION=
MLTPMTATAMSKPQTTKATVTCSTSTMMKSMEAKQEMEIMRDQ